MRTKPSEFRKRLSQVRAAQKKGDYAKALCTLEPLIEQWPGNAELLTMRAVLIQVQDERGPRLDEAKRSLEKALELEEDRPESLIELAHYEFAVEDDARGAAKMFERAVRICTRLLAEALLGQAKALLEMNRRQDAFDCLARVRWLQSASLDGYRQHGTADEDKILSAWEELAGIS